MSIHAERRLYTAAELPGLLQLPEDKIDWLIQTGQLHLIRIAGETRFDSREIDTLISTYLQISKRNLSYGH
jgi:hypothetical protein